MADKNVTTATAEPTDVVTRAKGFWERNSKPIIYAGTAVILLIGVWYAYKYFFVLPKEKAANEAIFPAENLFDKMGTTGFNKDSVNLVLNGGATNEGSAITGVLKIINKCGGTPAGNRAKYMAGASYLQIKEFDKAIKYLKEFDGNGANQVQSKAYVMLGHAYSEKKNVDEALSYYKKASTVNTKDESITSYALLLAASYADAMGKTKEAIEMYKEFKDKYPGNGSIGDVEKHLARLGVTE